MTILKDLNLTMVAHNVKVDNKRRVYLPKALAKEGIMYHIYSNSFGQIVFDPQVAIPASELWVFDNKDVLASIDKGMAESNKGKLIKRGSFAQHVKDAP